MSGDESKFCNAGGATLTPAYPPGRGHFDLPRLDAATTRLQVTVAEAAQWFIDIRH